MLVSNLDELIIEVEKLKSIGKKIVWTNGCFDILHIGHIRYLQQAKSCGDVLILGINSDDSIKQIKGPLRPIIPENDRAEIMLSLKSVDYVLIFHEPHPTRYLEILKPDVYAKGGDYTLDTINQDERKIVEGYGGKIALFPANTLASTTDIIEKIRSEKRE